MSNITLDLSIEKVAQFLDLLPSYYRINGKSIDACCICLCALYTIENLSIENDLCGYGTDTEDWKQGKDWIDWNAKGYIRCDCQLLEYSTIDDTINPSLSIPLPKWAIIFNRKQTQVGLATVETYRRVIKEVIERLIECHN